MEEFILKYWLEFIFGIFATAITIGFRKIAVKVKEQETVKEGVLAILHDRLYQAARYYTGQGEISISELKNVEYLYRAYHDLGGNGTGTELYQRICDLPLKGERKGE